MKEITTHKLNESYSVIDGPPDTLREIFDFLKVERPDAYMDKLVQSGFKSPYDYFASIQHKKLLVMNGHIQFLGKFGVPQLPDSESDYTIDEIDAFIDDIKKIIPFEPYDFQITAFKDSILNKKQINKMCTSSGKSVTISMLCEFMRRQGKKGLLLVPNINLLTQFKDDISSYNLTELFDNTHLIGGGNKERHFDNSLTISTWQSLQERFGHNLDLSEIDYVINDEVHKFSSLVSSDIVMKTVNCQYKWGFTGTIPENPLQKMQLFGMFGLPKTYITARELIDRGLATPIKINSLIMKYSLEERKIINECGTFPKKLKFIKEHEQRNQVITNLTSRLRDRGNTLLLFSHTEHGKTLFLDIMKKIHPDVEVLNKNITGKKSFEFQKEYGIFFLNGEDDPKTRELTRKILEDYENAILVANYQLLSTGVNIKRLFNLVLGSPLKSYTTVTQSIGRMMRKHDTKLEANVYDIVDDTGIRKPGGVFYKQYIHRKNVSYNTEEYPIKEIEIDLTSN